MIGRVLEWMDGWFHSVLLRQIFIPQRPILLSVASSLKIKGAFSFLIGRILGWLDVWMVGLRLFSSFRLLRPILLSVAILGVLEKKGSIYFHYWSNIRMIVLRFFSPIKSDFYTSKTNFTVRS